MYHCPQCDKHIKYPSKITEHIRKHTGEKAHQCVFCQKSFSQAHTLKAHMITHEHETPYKCSFCAMEFQDPRDKEEHEESHMEQADDVIVATNTTTTTTTFVQIEAPPILREEQEDVRGNGRQEVVVEESGVQQMCQIFECPEMCGFQSFDEQEVIAHIQMEQHGHHHLNEYETVCWTEEGGASQEHKNDDNTVPNGLMVVHQEYPSNSEQLYEYFPEQFVPQVESESIIHVEQEEPTVEGACTSSNYYSNPRNNADQILYGDEVEEVDEKVIKREDRGRNGRVYGNLIQIQHHLANDEDVDDGDDGVIVGTHHLDEEEEDVVDDDEDVEGGGAPGSSHIRVVVNPNPPKRGTKSLRDHHLATAAMTEMIVDANTFEMVQPRPIKYRMMQGMEEKRRMNRKKTMNVDWIIDAVAKGRDVNEASPHIRKKPTVHRCEYCGKVDKYPSKIRAHMRTHTGEKPFKCEICGMAFSQKTPMRLHLRRHLNQTPYPCEMDGCAERFVSRSLLKQHIEKKHLMKKKFVCRSGCGRVFSSSFNLRHHEKKCVNVSNIYQQVREGGGGGRNDQHHHHHHRQFVEEEEEEEDEELDDEEDDEEEMMEEDGVYMMGHMMEAEPIPEQHHFDEEPVFLHQ